MYSCIPIFLVSCITGFMKKITFEVSEELHRAFKTVLISNGQTMVEHLRGCVESYVDMTAVKQTPPIEDVPLMKLSGGEDTRIQGLPKRVRKRKREPRCLSEMAHEAQMCECP